MISSPLPSHVLHIERPNAPRSVFEIISKNRAAVAPGHAQQGTRILSFRATGQGLSGVANLTVDVQTGRYTESLDAGPLHERRGFDGLRVWSTDLSGAVTTSEDGYAKRIAVSRAYRYANAWWLAGYGGAHISYLRTQTTGGRACDLLAISPLGGALFEACFDRVNHDLVKIIEPSGFQPTATVFSDFQTVDGAREAGLRVIDDGSGAAFARTERVIDARLLPVQPVATFGPPGSRSDFNIRSESGETTVPFRLIGSHIYGDVFVNDQGPFTFLFDTGAEDTISPSLANALRLPVAGASPVGGAGAGVEEAGYTSGVTLKLGGLVLDSQTLHVLPPVGKGTVDFRVDGVIGAEVSRRVVTRIDYSARKISFIDPAKFNAQEAGRAVPIDFFDQVPMIHGRVDGLTTSFIIDTGNGGELDLTSPFVKQHSLIAKHPSGLMAGNLGGIGGAIRFYVTRVKSVFLGDVSVQGVLARMSLQKAGALAASDIGGDVGSGLLRRFIVTFDYEHRVMYLQPRSGLTPGAGGFDRSGLTLASSSAGVVVVSILPDSPATVAGLEVGDLIVKVNGESIPPAGLSTFREELIRNPAGTRIGLEVRRGSTLGLKTLVLKDLIP